MSRRVIDIPATCQANAVAVLAEGLHRLDLEELQGVELRFTEPGQPAPWAVLHVDTYSRLVSAFPRYLDGRPGDSDRRRGHMGVRWQLSDNIAARRHAAGVVLSRSGRMIRDEAKAVAS